MATWVRNPNHDTGPRVQQLVMGSHRETGVESQDSAGAGLSVSTPALLDCWRFFMQIITWAMGAVAAYRLWEDYAWLSVLVAILALSFSVQPDEQHEQNATGLFSDTTGTRLMLTTVATGAILLFSFFV